MGSLDLIRSSLRIIYYLSMIGSNGIFIYYLMNKTTPPLMKTLNILMNIIIDDRQIIDEYLSTMIVLLYRVYIFQMQNYQIDLMIRCKNNIKNILYNKLQNYNNK